MRIVMVAESFLPHVNGVANSVLHTVEHLGRRGHDIMVVAPGPGPEMHLGVPVVRTRAVPFPGYRDVAVGLARRSLETTFRRFSPDVVHVASPAVLGAAALQVTSRHRIPSVAVFQTDLARFAASYRLRWTAPMVWRWLCRVHRRADLTLAPSSPLLSDLRSRGVAKVALWARGVDTDAFHPHHRQASRRRRPLVGYVGRLAREKEVHHLVHLSERVDLIVVGDGPSRPSLEKRLPRARFTGFLSGRSLSEAMASLDVFVHTGRSETFCQTIQEAMASGVPVVAPAAGGPLDLVAPDLTGYLWDPHRPETIGGLVDRIALDPDLRRQMSEHAVAAVAGRTWSSTTTALLGHYRTVLRHQGRRAA